jgi:hypothetical protein
MSVLFPATIVIPAKAGIQFQAAGSALLRNWIPAFAGMTP